MIGRIAIDNIAIAHAKSVKAIVVDITETGHHVHQGVDRNSKIKRSDEDKKYNLVYYNQYDKYRAALNNADIVYHNDSHQYSFK